MSTSIGRGRFITDLQTCSEAVASIPKASVRGDNASLNVKAGAGDCADCAITSCSQAGRARPDRLTGTVKSIGMIQCLQCKSQHVTKGRIENYDSHGSAIFRPHGLRMLSFTPSGGTKLSEEAYACLDCGLVWSSTPADKLSAFVQKHCAKTWDASST